MRSAMAMKIRLKENATVGLKLLPEERQMLLDLPLLDEGLSGRLEQTPPGESQVKFTLNELDLLAGEITGHANHTKDRCESTRYLYPAQPARLLPKGGV